MFRRLVAALAATGAFACSGTEPASETGAAVPARTLPTCDGVVQVEPGPRFARVSWSACGGPAVTYALYLDGTRVREVQGTATLLTVLDRTATLVVTASSPGGDYTFPPVSVAGRDVVSPDTRAYTRLSADPEAK